MRDRVSIWFLLAIVAVVGIFLFRVVQPFLAPLFLAAVLALLAYPQYEWAVARIGGRRRAAAALTMLLLLLGLIPLAGALSVIGQELTDVAGELSRTPLSEGPIAERVLHWVQDWFPDVRWETIRGTVGRGLETTVQEVFIQTQAVVNNVVSFLIGVAIMSMALYYFLVDGKSLVGKIHRLSPLYDGEEAILVYRFGAVCRGVVLGTLLCAVAQATLLGLGLWLAGIDRVLVLSGLTLLFSMVPVVGAAGIYGPLAVWLLWQGRVGAGLFVGAYGALVVSTADNLVRAYVLNGSANMHPLLALVSALGGLRLVGIWGIFLGPVMAALFYSLLTLLHDRVEDEANSRANAQLEAREDRRSSPRQSTNEPVEPQDTAALA